MSKDKEEGIKLNVIDDIENPGHKEENIKPAKKQNIPQKKSDELNMKFIKKVQFWQILSVIFFVLFITSLLYISGSSKEIVEIDAKNIVQSYVDRLEIARPSISIEVGDISERNGLYNVKLMLQGQEIDSYLSKDGKLFFPTGVELDQVFDRADVQDDIETPKVNVSINDEHVLGELDAPVTIIEFSDFQCPFCKRFRDQTFDKIKEKYIDTGKVRFVYMNFPLKSHENSQKAAEAAECAHEQGKFWEYHDILFENQQKLAVEDLKKYSADFGLDTEKFNDCLDSGKMKDEVNKDFEDGITYGVQGTPAFFINDMALSGAQSFEKFKSIIEKELAKEVSE